MTLTETTQQLNVSKLGLYLKIEACEAENMLFIMMSDEPRFDAELDDEIGHIAKYSANDFGDLKCWIVTDAERKLLTISMSLYRYLSRKLAKINTITLL